MEQPTEHKSSANQFTFEIKTFAFKQGFEWLGQGFDLFKKNALWWVIGYMAYLGGMMLLSFIPYIGSLIASVLASGIYVVAQQRDQDKPFDLMAVLNSLKHSALPLGVLCIINSIVAMAIFYPIVGESAQPLFSETPPTPEQLSEFMYNTLIGLCVYLIPAMAFIFSPIIVVLHSQVSAYQAMVFSFKACILNTMPLTAFGLVFAALFFISFIPLGLGLLIVLPITICSLYVAHKDIFCAPGATSLSDKPSRDDVMSA